MKKKRNHVLTTHITNDKGRIMATFVTVETKDGEVGQGIALCSYKEDGRYKREYDLDWPFVDHGPNGKKGRKIALGRAWKAIHKKKNFGLFSKSDDALEILKEIDFGKWTHRCVYIGNGKIYGKN